MLKPLPARRGSVSPRLLLDPGHFLALGGGTGLSSYAPGTVGSVVGIALYIPLSALPPGGYAAVVALLFLIGVPICGRAAAALGEHDHGAIVWDEVVGYVITVMFCSTGIFGIAVGFVAFRFCDVVKPWPARRIDRQVGGGLGIMLDDAVAAVYALVALEVIEYFSISYKLII